MHTRDPFGPLLCIKHFVSFAGGCEVAEKSEAVVSDVAKLLAVEPAELKMSLATRIMTTTKGGGFGTMYKYVQRGVNFWCRYQMKHQTKYMQQ